MCSTKKACRGVVTCSKTRALVKALLHLTGVLKTNTALMANNRLYFWICIYTIYKKQTGGGGVGVCVFVEGGEVVGGVDRF